MKRIAFVTGFLLITSIIALPLLLIRKQRREASGIDENLRYDINDYVAQEGL